MGACHEFESMSEKPGSQYLEQGVTGTPVRRELIIPNPKLKLMDQVKEVMRLRHYSIRTEQCYCDWIRRFVKFHGMKSRSDLDGGEAKIELFLGDLAVQGQVAASTQNQAFNALLFLYREVLGQELGTIQALRADRPARLPTVLTPEESTGLFVTHSSCAFSRLRPCCRRRMRCKG